MSDGIEEVVASATEEAVTEVAEPAQASAETEITEATSDHMIPKSRFDEINGKRKDAEREAQELRDRIAEYEAASERPDPEPEGPPANASEAERVQWTVEHYAKGMIERELGVSLGEAKTLLSTTRSTSTDYAERRWSDMCAKHQIDPKSEEVREMVMGLVRGASVPLDKALERAGKLYGKSAGTPAPERVTARVEDSGVSPVMTSSVSIPKTRQEAMELAHKGVRAPHVSSQEILNAAIAQKRNGA